MSNKNIQTIFFVIISAFLLWLSFLVFKPYLGVIFLASVLAVAFYPLYKKILEKINNHKNLASLITVIIIIFCIIIPVVFLSTRLISESIDIYNAVAFKDGNSIITNSSNFILSKVQNTFTIGDSNLNIDIEGYLRSTLSWVIGHFDSVFSALFDGIFKFIIMLLTLYYLFINGENIKKNLILWSPLPDLQDEEFLETLHSAVDAVLKGRFLVSMAQGLFLGIGFWIFGVGNPVLWGFVGAIASLIPMLGTSIIIIPAVVFLFLKGDMPQGLGLLIWGVVCVGLIDNFLSFIFLKDKIKIHPLIVLFSIIGGVEVFGAIGFLLGPVIISGFMAIIKIYPLVLLYKKDKNDLSVLN